MGQQNKGTVRVQLRNWHARTTYYEYNDIRILMLLLYTTQYNTEHSQHSLATHSLHKHSLFGFGNLETPSAENTVQGVLHLALLALETRYCFIRRNVLVNLLIFFYSISPLGTLVVQIYYLNWD